MVQPATANKKAVAALLVLRIRSGGEKMATKDFLSATKPLARSRAVVAVVVAVGVAVAVGVLCQQPGAQAQDATVGPSYTVKDLGTLGGNALGSIAQES
jgi:hypothetical protein